MLSGVLRSYTTIHLNIAVTTVVVEMRRLPLKQTDFQEEIPDLKRRNGAQDIKLSQFYKAIENLLRHQTEPKKWNESEGKGSESKLFILFNARHHYDNHPSQ